MAIIVPGERLGRSADRTQHATFTRGGFMYNSVLQDTAAASIPAASLQTAAGALEHTVAISSLPATTVCPSVGTVVVGRVTFTSRKNAKIALLEYPATLAVIGDIYALCGVGDIVRIRVAGDGTSATMDEPSLGVILCADSSTNRKFAKA